MFDLCEYLGRDKKHLFQKVLDIKNVKDTSKLEFPMWISEKFDGVFCCAFYKPDGTVGIFSRTGEEYLSMNHLKSQLFYTLLDKRLRLLVLFEAMIDGEKQIVISGACRDPKKQHPEIKAYVHSFIDKDNWFMRAWEVKDFNIGRKHLIATATKDVFFIPNYIVTNLDSAYIAASIVWDRGGEGVVLTFNADKYQPGKRNESMIKIKQGVSVDLEVVDTYEGKGKYSGTLGGLICRYKDNKSIKVSGMTDVERSAWWGYKSLIVGKIVQIDAMAESANGLLREPRFKGIRYDKDTADF